MHVLTKIFVVLVSLMAVMLVPLLVVYTANEDAYQVRYKDAVAKESAAKVALQKADASFGLQVKQKDAEIEMRTAETVRLQDDLGDRDTSIRRLEVQLAETSTVNDEIMARLSTLAKSVEAGEMLTSTLIDELRDLRRDALAAERQKVELDEALRETTARLDVAEEARRFLQEELQRVKEEQASALDDLEAYYAKYGAIDKRTVSTGVLPDRALVAGVSKVRQTANETLVEINAGQRDGVKKGWKMTIGEGGRYVATIIIIEVDINQSVGRVDLEKSTIRIGQRAYAVPRN